MRDIIVLRLYTDRRCAVLIIAFAVLICTLFTGCGDKKGSQKNTKSGGVLYFGIETPFHGFDVLGTSGYLNPTMAPLNNLIQEPLFRMDKSGNLIPVLGLTASLSANGTHWDITLRQNVLFHDGTPFNADAVIHHWSRILDSENKYRGRPLFKPIRRVMKIDDYTVRFVLEHPWLPFLKVISDELLLFNFIPSPKAVTKNIHDKKPVGTGPFKYDSWGYGDHFVVLKNHKYWQKGKPHLNKVIFRTIPDHQTRFASLVSGQVDIITLDRGSLINKAKKDPELYTFHSEGNGAEIIMINTERPPLDDIRIRRALALASKQALHIKIVYGDTIPLIHHPLGEGFECADDGYLEFNPEKAKQLIAEYGRPVELECLHSNTSRGRDIGAVLQRLYKDIGINLKPIGLSTGPQVMKVLQKNYQLATWRIPPSRDFGPQLYRSFHSRSPTNFTGYNNSQLDRLLEEQRIETDPGRRDDLRCRIIRQLNQDVPFLYRGGRRFHVVAKKKIMNMMDSPGFMIDLSSAWLDEKIKFNATAFQIEEKAAVVDIDCPEPGNTEAVKKMILGSWKGKDSWGGTLTYTFKKDNTVTGTRSGGYNLKGKYIICGTNVIWRSNTGALISMTVLSDKQLKGTFQKGAYGGTISAVRDKTALKG
jgi:4-phytase/acid phosphatase/peptide/nickel transport system substrate-binding protein